MQKFRITPLMQREVHIFLNAKSGAGQATPEHLQQQFSRHGLTATVTHLTHSTDLAACAAQHPAGLLWVAAGGDGTIRAVAEVLAGTPRPLGVLALGTLNHFARDLHLPIDLEPAVAFIARAEPGAVDTAEVNGITFVNNSSLGAYPAMVMDRERMKKSGRNKWISLLAASFKAFVRFRRLTVTFCVDGQTRSCTTPFLFVGNNEYCLDAARLGQREHLDRGELSLYLAPGATRATMLRFLAAATIGRLQSLPSFHNYNTTEFTVTAPFRRRIRVSVDGEVRRLPGPLTYRIRPASLQVLQVPGVPRP